MQKEGVGEVVVVVVVVVVVEAATTAAAGGGITTTMVLLSSSLSSAIVDRGREEEHTCSGRGYALGFSLTLLLLAPLVLSLSSCVRGRGLC